MASRLDGHTYTTAEVAALLGIAERTAYVWAKRDGQLGGVEPIIVGRAIRYPKRLIDQRLGINPRTKKRPHSVQRATAPEGN